MVLPIINLNLTLTDIIPIHIKRNTIIPIHIKRNTISRHHQRRTRKTILSLILATLIHQLILILIHILNRNHNNRILLLLPIHIILFRMDIQLMLVKRPEIVLITSAHPIEYNSLLFVDLPVRHHNFRVNQ